MLSPVAFALWPLLGGVLLLGAIPCFVTRRWGIGAGLAIPGLLFLGAWQYDRAHETITRLHVAMLDQKLVKEDKAHPGNSLYFVRVTALELGDYQGTLRASEIRFSRPGSIVAVDIGKRPLTGSYLKAVANTESQRTTSR